MSTAGGIDESDAATKRMLTSRNVSDSM